MHKLILDLAWGRTGDRYSSWLHHVNQNSSTNIAANMTFECLVTLTHQTRQIWQYRHWNFHPITKLDASPQFHTKKMEVGSEIPHSRIVFLKQLKVIPIFIIRLTLTNLSLYIWAYVLWRWKKPQWRHNRKSDLVSTKSNVHEPPEFDNISNIKALFLAEFEKNPSNYWVESLCGYLRLLLLYLRNRYMDWKKM